MPIQAIQNRRLYQQVADQLRALIESGEYAAGSVLPAERDLSAQLGVSRTSVREALIALEIAGLVEVRGGSGIYVSPSAGLARGLFESQDAGPGPFELLRARLLVEGEIAALAAAAVAADDLAFLGQTIATLESSAGYIERDEADRLFHLRIAEATSNSALVQTVRMYWDLRRGPMWKRIVEHFDTPALLAAVIADHRAILGALRTRQPAAARRAMRRHLERVEQEFAKGWTEASGVAKSRTGRPQRSRK